MEYAKELLNVLAGIASSMKYGIYLQQIIQHIISMKRLKTINKLTSGHWVRFYVQTVYQRHLGFQCSGFQNHR